MAGNEIEAPLQTQFKAPQIIAAKEEASVAKTAKKKRKGFFGRRKKDKEEEEAVEEPDEFAEYRSPRPPFLRTPQN